MRGVSHFLLLFILLSGFFTAAAGAQGSSLSSSEVEKIGKKVFQNECAGREICLVEWNTGENFLSLGIGHFIWYPRGAEEVFEGSFIKFLDYLKTTGTEIPAWLNEEPAPPCPWNSRDDFLADAYNPKLTQLRGFLSKTKKEQALFLVKRLREALPLMIQAAPEKLRPHITKQFFRVMNAPGGVYALVDYINFKGSGVFSSERYNGQGWGLLQVLENMSGEENGVKALEEFSAVAERLLTERVDNAPPERSEGRWLPGWKNRVRSYAPVDP